MSLIKSAPTGYVLNKITGKFDSDRVSDLVNRTVWEDLRFPINGLTLAGVRAPGLVKTKDDGAGSTGVYVYGFDTTNEEEVFGVAQMPHAWKIGSALHPHIHWMPGNTNTGTVVWGLEYTWASINGTFGNTTLITVADPSHKIAWKHQIVELPDILATGISGVSSCLMFRLYRSPGDSRDNYASDAYLLEFDIHYEIDSLGSDSEYTK